MTAAAGNLRAGLIGLGSMGRIHARVLTELDGVDLVAVADPAGDLTGAARGAPVLTSTEAMIERGIDYCVVAVPTNLHLEVGLLLAEAGIHALIEKPVAFDTAASQQLVQAFEAASLIGAVGHIERYNPALQHLKARLEAGELGEIYQVATRRQGPFPGRIADVGVVMDLATHDLDLTAWVTGSSFDAISGRIAHKSGRAHEDLVAATGHLADGTITNHLVNWLSPMKERVTVVTGDKGTFEANTLTADLTFHANGTIALEWRNMQHFRGMSEGDMVRYAYAKHEPLRVEHEAFRDAVLGKDADIVTLQQGLDAVRVAEALLESTRRDEVIHIEQ